MLAIETHALTKRYGAARGIDGVALAVEQGAFYGFIGPNGAGKSTTIRTLLGLLRPTSGSAQVLGMNIASHREAILARVGYLPSESAFYPGMRVRDVLRLSSGLRGTDCRGEAAELCGQLQLDEGRKVSELSFGNRKKVGIVCALQHRPELLILDEPTSGLDPLMQRALFDILERRHREGATIFLSSHVLSEIQRHCQRAAIIREGRIIAEGTVEELSHTGARRIVLRGEAELSTLPGLKDMKREGDSLSFLYSGSMDNLLRVLSRGHVDELSVSEPDLEEIFLHYYSEGGDGQ